MHSNKTFLAIITARGKSKRLPNKNILNFNGKPLIAWTIQSALQSKYIDKVVVSSENDKIINISKKYGAEIPFKRPNYLAQDKSSSENALLHAINFFNKKNIFFDYLVLLQPTSPLRNTKMIDEAIDLLIKKKGKGIVSVCEFNNSKKLINSINKNSLIDKFIVNTKNNLLNSSKNYIINGAIYIVDIKQFLKERSFYLNEKMYAYLMEKKSSIDIDNKIDFAIAKYYIKKNKN